MSIRIGTAVSIVALLGLAACGGGGGGGGGQPVTTAPAPASDSTASAAGTSDTTAPSGTGSATTGGTDTTNTPPVDNTTNTPPVDNTTNTPPVDNTTNTPPVNNTPSTPVVDNTPNAPVDNTIAGGQPVGPLGGHPFDPGVAQSTTEDQNTGWVTEVLKFPSLNGGSPTALANVTITTSQEGRLQTVQINTANYSHAFDFARNGIMFGAAAGFPQVNDPGVPLFMASEGRALPGTTQLKEHNLVLSQTDYLSFASFGSWANIDADTGAAKQLGAAVWGRETLATEMPRTGTASYAGLASGFLNDGRDTFGLKGNLGMTANFAGGTVAGGITDIEALKGADLTRIGSVAFSNGAISGSRFSGGATFSPPSTTDVTMSGTMSGAFFGPTASEVAGTVNLSGGSGRAAMVFGGKPLRP